MTAATVKGARPVPMATVLGCDLQVGDLIGSVWAWQVQEVGAPVVDDGWCADRAAALYGRCSCTRRGADPDRMPRRVLIGAGREPFPVFDHLRYAIHARPVPGRR
jgi:hypothetical protein